MKRKYIKKNDARSQAINSQSLDNKTTSNKVDIPPKKSDSRKERSAEPEKCVKKQFNYSAESCEKIKDIIQRPARSYTSLIEEAIKKSPGRRLVLRDIYKYFEDAYPYFKGSKSGWKVS